jgi:prevent-host-death family protein
MKTVSMLEFRHAAEQIIDQVRKGQRLVLTYRGKPVARIEPIQPEDSAESDSFYSLTSLAERKAKSITNRQMDETIYGR